MAPELSQVSDGSKPKKDKSGKKGKPHDGKKRKREHGEESEKHRSKKLRKEKQRAAEGTASTGNDSAVKESPFHTLTATLYLPLASISQRYPLEGMCAEHLSPLILTYYPPFDGVVLSYSNPRLAERPFRDDGSHVLLQCIDEYAVSYGWVTADFLLFKPSRGVELEGYVNLQNEGHLGLVCWNLFNTSIARQRLPKDWRWVTSEETGESDGQGVDDLPKYSEEGIGYYVDGNGIKIEGMLKFRVTEIEYSHDRERGFLSISGTMLDKDDEKELSVREAASSKPHKDAAGRRLGGSKALGATSLGRPVESSQEDMEIGRREKAL